MSKIFYNVREYFFIFYLYFVPHIRIYEYHFIDECRSCEESYDFLLIQWFYVPEYIYYYKNLGSVRLSYIQVKTFESVFMHPTYYYLEKSLEFKKNV